MAREQVSEGEGIVHESWFKNVFGVVTQEGVVNEFSLYCGAVRRAMLLVLEARSEATRVYRPRFSHQEPSKLTRRFAPHFFLTLTCNLGS